MKRILARAGMVLAAALLAAGAVWAQQATGREPGALDALVAALKRPEEIFSGQTKQFRLEMTVEAWKKEAGKDEGGEAPAVAPSAYKFLVARDGEHAFAMRAEGTPAGTFSLIRTEVATAIVDENHKRVFVGEGPLPTGADALEPGAFARATLSAHGDLAVVAEAVTQAQSARVLAMQLVGMLQLKEAASQYPTLRLVSGQPVGGRTVTLDLVPEESRISAVTWAGPTGEGKVLYSLTGEAKLPTIPGDGYERVAVARAELERTLMRGVPRAMEILYRREHPRSLRDTERNAEGGRLVVSGGRRIVTLEGDAATIGKQHGALLRREVQRDVNAVIYTLALGESMRTGNWFLGELRKVWAATSPHIGVGYKTEMAALAEASGMTAEEVQLANVLPELIHCSGFVVMGKATADGALYHGRVLDYMTVLGLQDEAVVFIVKKQDAIAFANIGFAGLVGSVSGMNAEGVALGDIGGEKTGPFDGMPMAILSREVMERAKTADEAVGIIEKAKRTGEFYYVASDPKSGRAMVATPEKLTVVKPGESTELWPGVPADCVLASRGGRYRALVERVKGAYGKIDAEAARTLMAEGVAATGSNLQNVLFVPATGRFWVQTAGGQTDAWAEGWMEYDLKKLLEAPAGE